MLNKFLIGFLLLVELYVIGYATLVAYLLNVWMESDNFALQATELDWWLLAGRRVVITLFFALLISAVIYYINRLLVRRRYLPWPGLHRYSAWLSFACMTTASLVGAVGFIINKPYI